MNVGSLLDILARDLNDYANDGYKHVTWSAEQLRTYLGEGLQLAFANRPDLFMETKVIPVEPCTEVQTKCDCDTIHRVLGQSTKGGRVIKGLRRRNSQSKLIWPGDRCPVDPNKFELKSYSVDSMTGTLRLYPPAPPLAELWVLVECAVRPSGDITDDMEIPVAVDAAVKQWVYYRAKTVDGENNPNILSVANGHKSTFWEILLVEKRVRDEAKAAEAGSTS